MACSSWWVIADTADGPTLIELASAEAPTFKGWQALCLDKLKWPNIPDAPSETLRPVEPRWKVHMPEKGIHLETVPLATLRTLANIDPVRADMTINEWNGDDYDYERTDQDEVAALRKLRKFAKSALHQRKHVIEISIGAAIPATQEATARSAMDNAILHSPDQLPDIDSEALFFVWDQIETDTVIRFGNQIVWREETGWEVYDRFEEIAAVLKQKYGRRLIDMVPTLRSEYALYGDASYAWGRVQGARESLARHER
jgi:hypothetical protein